MKVAGLLFVALIACASATAPEPFIPDNETLSTTAHAPIENKTSDERQARLVESIIANAVETISQNIRDAGLDPFVFEKYISFGLPVPLIFSVAASMQKLKVSNASNIVINSVSYAVLTSRLTLDISIPEILVQVDDAWFNLTVLGRNFSGHTNSSLAIINPSVSGEVRLNLGIISGVSVRDINLNFSLDGMQYNGYADLLGNDITPMLHHLFEFEIPAALNETRNEISQLIEIIVTEIINNL